MTTFGDLPDPDWYLDHVLVHASPGTPDPEPERPAVAWTRWWQGRAAELRLRGDPATDLALTQGFVVGTTQLAELGWLRHELRREVRRRTWSAVARGVGSPMVLPVPSPDDPDRFDVGRRRHSLRAAAAVFGRRDQLISARSATILHGLPVLRMPSMPEVTGRTPSALGRRRQAHVYGARLTSADETRWFGAPCTTVARTVVDQARHDRRDGLIAADAALYSGILTMRELRDALERASGWPGIRQARAVLALAIDEAESPLESLTRLALHDSGFPAPRPQTVIRDQARRCSYRVDLCWPEARFVVEADGRVKYGGDAGWREKQRETRLRALGFHVERVLWDDVVRHWPETRDRLWRELHARRAFPA